MKKTIIIWAITLVIAGLMITSAVSIPVENNDTQPSVTIQKLDNQPQALQMAITGQAQLQTTPQPLDTYGAIELEGDQVHPAFGRTLGGKHMVAYRDQSEENIIWTYSADDGETYDVGVFYDIGGDYPSIKLWGGERFFGTFVTDFFDLDGAPTYLFEVANPADYGTYELTFWDWSSFGWYGMEAADIACDNSQNQWEWGISSYVTSTTYGDGYQNGPTIVYADPDEIGQGWIGWYYGFDGCATTSADIDPITKYAYIAYDWLNETTWKLIVRVKDFDDVREGFDSMYLIEGDGNLQYPSVAANNDNVVILAQTDANGQSDIICYYSNDKLSTLETSIVADSLDDDVFPEVRHAEDNTFVATFVSNEVLYKTISEDGGMTWSEPEALDDVVEEYKTAAITDFAAQALYQKQAGDDIDLWLVDPLYEISTPVLEITSISGGVGVSATVENTGIATANDVIFDIKVSGGLLGLVSKQVQAPFATLDVGASETLETGMFFGIGPITIDVKASASNAGEVTEQKSGFLLGFFVLGL